MVAAAAGTPTLIIVCWCIGALYALMGKELTGKKSYQYGFKYELPDTPAVTKANVNQWLGNGWGDWDRSKCGQFRVP
jgi:hypothetical protein